MWKDPAYFPRFTWNTVGEDLVSDSDMSVINSGRESEFAFVLMNATRTYLYTCKSLKTEMAV